MIRITKKSADQLVKQGRKLGDSLRQVIPAVESAYEALTSFLASTRKDRREDEAGLSVGA